MMFEGVNRISRIYWVRICNEECRRKHIEFTIFFLNSIIFSIDYKRVLVSNCITYVIIIYY